MSDKIIEMIKEAGLVGEPSLNVVNFANSLLKLERERIAQKIEKLPFGDTSASFAIFVRENAEKN